MDFVSQIKPKEFDKDLYGKHGYLDMQSDFNQFERKKIRKAFLKR